MVFQRNVRIICFCSAQPHITWPYDKKHDLYSIISKLLTLRYKIMQTAYITKSFPNTNVDQSPSPDLILK